jgi:hypothetical protein
VRGKNRRKAAGTWKICEVIFRIVDFVGVFRGLLYRLYTT